MPYNLRERKAPAPPPIERKRKAPASQPVEKKRKAPVSQPVEKKRKLPASQQIEEKVESPSPQPVEKKRVRTQKPVQKKEEVPPPQQKEKKRRTPTPQPIEEEKKVPSPKAKEKKRKTPTPQPIEEEVEAPSAQSIKEEDEVPSPEPVEKKKAKKEVAVAHGSNQMVFGSDMGGELGLGKLGFDKKNPTFLPLQEQIKQVACGGTHTISLTEAGKVYSYGCNDDGALGRVTNGEEELEATPTLVELDDKVTKITAGDSHCAALTEKMEVYIWGNFRDENGMVGLTPGSEGKATFKPTKVKIDKQIKDIASGGNHMLLLDVDGVIYSFGVGDHGQLGRLGPEDSAKKITSETRELFLVPKPVDMKKVDPARPFVGDAVFAGEYTSYATNTDKKKNRTAAWGLNNYHQLGYKGSQGQLDQHYPRRSTFTCSTSMISVAGGQHHTIFLTKTGRVYAAGRTEYGILGLGSKLPKKEDVCPAQEVTGFDSPVKIISTGSRTSFAVTSTGKLYSWGMNGLNLGVDGDNDLTEPTLVEKLAGKKVVSVSGGPSATCVIVEQS